MGFDAFLKLDGVKGESRDSKHPDEIEIHSFSWGVSSPATLSTGGGGATTRASFQDFTFTADSSSASLDLFLASATGKHLQEGLISVRREATAKEAGQDYYTVKLTDVLVTGYEQAGSSSGDRPVDQFSLNYAKIEITYAQQKADGSLDTPRRVGYDLATAKTV